jgi:hypothetical protein
MPKTVSVKEFPALSLRALFLYRGSVHCPRSRKRGDSMNHLFDLAVARRVLLAGMLLAFGSATAAPGYTVTERDLRLIKVGMTTGEVERALGPPMWNFKYRNAPGPQWFYDVSGVVVPTVLEVAFDSNGIVILARDYPDLSRNISP